MLLISEMNMHQPRVGAKQALRAVSINGGEIGPHNIFTHKPSASPSRLSFLDNPARAPPCTPDAIYTLSESPSELDRTSHR